MHSTIAHPFKDFAHGGFLTIHENADAIDLAGEPRHAEGRGVEEREAEHFLPEGDTEGDAHHHDDGGGEGEERSPKSQGTVGVATTADGGIHAEDEQEGDGKGELDGVFLTVDGRTDGGEEGGKEEVAADEVEDEANEDFEEGEIERCGEGLVDVLG